MIQGSDYLAAWPHILFTDYAGSYSKDAWMYRVHWGKATEDIRLMKVAMKGYRWGQTGNE